MDGEQLTEQETALYDRQIRVWGADAQRRYLSGFFFFGVLNDPFYPSFQSPNFLWAKTNYALDIFWVRFVLAKLRVVVKGFWECGVP